MSENGIKNQVRKFYDQVGWQMVSDGIYQNARYEDLRPVSREYIERCHLRVNRYLERPGKFLLDAGSGPIQYPAYLTYMEGYQYRVCADISIVALQEARKRIGDQGLYVVSDVAKLPFKSNTYSGVVSLHTLHHLPLDEQKKAYSEIYRILEPGKTAVLVNGWTESKLMKRWHWLELFMERLGNFILKLRGKNLTQKSRVKKEPVEPEKQKKTNPTGTYVEKLTASWIRNELAGKDLKILVWRSVSVRFLRAVFHTVLLGKVWLKVLFALEEAFPTYFGEQGQYPLIVFRKL